MGVSSRQFGVSTATQSQGMSSVPERLLEDEQRVTPIVTSRHSASCAGVSHAPSVRGLPEKPVDAGQDRPYHHLACCWGMRRIAVPTPCRYATAWCWPLINASTFGFVVAPCPQSPLSGTRPRRRPRSLRGVADAMIKASAALGAPTLTRLEGASREHVGLSRGRGRTCRMANASVSLWSCSCCSGALGPSRWHRKVSKRGGAALPC
jgi:hypothetical protein